ncbi:MAG: type II toxin-antitoxin system RelE/ParE family toxin [Euryarchaeota archaeon]|nr:type II toxin-antitoxin system RelE/ParE family toxin [Euryarchaeota archaeon]
MKKLVWAEPALDDLKNIFDYIANDSEHYANVFVNDLIDCAEKVGDFPKMGRIVPEYNKKDIREILYETYRVIYRSERDRITILTIIHGKRELIRSGDE